MDYNLTVSMNICKMVGPLNRCKTVYPNMNQGCARAIYGWAMVFGVVGSLWVALYEADFFDVRIFCVGHFMLPHHGVRRTTDRHKTPDSDSDSDTSFECESESPCRCGDVDWQQRRRQRSRRRQEATATAASSTKSAVFGELEQFSMRAACCFCLLFLRLFVALHVEDL